jgi:hypothetical protein
VRSEALANLMAPRDGVNMILSTSLIYLGLEPPRWASGAAQIGDEQARVGVSGAETPVRSLPSTLAMGSPWDGRLEMLGEARQALDIAAGWAR